MRATRLVIVVVAVVCCASLPLVGSSVRAEDKPVARAKWEYRVLNTSELVELVKDDDAFKKAMAGKGFPRIVERTLAPQFALNKLGDDGWELSAVVAVQVSNDETDNLFSLKKESVYYLKRPK